jgi:hypothetical protein
VNGRAQGDSHPHNRLIATSDNNPTSWKSSVGRAHLGTAILLATHDQAVVEVADRVPAIEDGRVTEAKRAETQGLPS